MLFSAHIMGFSSADKGLRGSPGKAYKPAALSTELRLPSHKTPHITPVLSNRDFTLRECGTGSMKHRFVIDSERHRLATITES